MCRVSTESAPPRNKGTLKKEMFEVIEGESWIMTPVFWGLAMLGASFFETHPYLVHYKPPKNHPEIAKVLDSKSRNWSIRQYLGSIKNILQKITANTGMDKLPVPSIDHQLGPPNAHHPASLTETPVSPCRDPNSCVQILSIQGICMSTGDLEKFKTSPPFFGMQSHNWQPMLWMISTIWDDAKLKWSFGSCGKDYSKTLVCSISENHKNPNMDHKKKCRSWVSYHQPRWHASDGLGWQTRSRGCNEGEQEGSRLPPPRNKVM